MEYRHTQAGWFGPPVIGLFALISVPILAAEETSAWFTAVMVAFMVGLVGVVVLFSWLRVTVSGGQAVAAFGFGWPRRVIELSEVVAVRQVRNRWWYGWGMRKVPGGWMYNVWGLDAVELEFASSKVFRIGTDEPEELFTALSLQLTQ